MTSAGSNSTKLAVNSMEIYGVRLKEAKRLVAQFERERIAASRILPHPRFGAEHGCSVTSKSGAWVKVKRGLEASSTESRLSIPVLRLPGLCAPGLSQLLDQS